MMMIGAPLALSFGRKNVVADCVLSILVGVRFGEPRRVSTTGHLGCFPVPVAAIGPFVIFGSVGLYLLSRTRT